MTALERAIAVGLIMVVFLSIYNLILIQMFLPSTCFLQEKYSWLEVKYIIISSKNQTKTLEVVDKIWINGAPDYANRPFKFLLGSTVTLTAPEQIGGAHFAFWQREEGPTFQGLILTNRTITITLSWPKEIWWANYVLEEN